MAKSTKPRKAKTLWNRILAFTLVVSLLLIPVQFPGAAKASSTDPAYPRYFSDDFSDDKYFNGVHEDGVTTKWNISAGASQITYKWEAEESAVSSSQVSDGIYTATIGREPDGGQTSNYEVYLNATSADPEDPEKKVDITDGWTDYTVEFDYNIAYENITSWNPGVYVHGRWQYDAEHDGYSGYGVKLHPTVGIYVAKYYYDTEAGKWVLKNNRVTGNTGFKAAFENDEFVHVKVTFSNEQDGTVKITTTLTDKDGNLVGNVNGHSWTDDGTVGGAVYTSGSVGLSFDRMHPSKGEQANWTAKFKNYTVTGADGSAIFKDDFADNSYFVGKTVGGESATGTTQFTHKWEAKESTVSSSQASGGVYTAAVGREKDGGQTSNYYVYLNAAAADPKEPAKTVDVTDGWADYTVEFDYNIAYENIDSWNPGVYVHGRSQYDAEHGGYTSYAVKLHPTVGIYVFKYYYNTDTGKWAAYTPGKLAGRNFKASFNNDAFVHVKVTFANNPDGTVTITTTLTNQNGDTVGQIDSVSWTDTGVNGGAALTSGSVGLSFDRMNPSKGEQANWTAKFKNYTVTCADGSAIFEDNFADDSYFVGKSEAEEWATWTPDDGKLSVNALFPSVNLVSAMGGQEDYALDWTDYAVDANVMLTTYNSAAGLIANSNGTDYYEMELTTSGVKLYKVSGETATVLAEKDMTLAVNTWHSAKLTVDNDGKTLMGYVDSELVFEKELTDGVLSKGTTGLKVLGNVQFDDFAAYAVELSDNRLFATYTFDVSNVTELGSNWDVVTDGTWVVTDGKLTYQNSDATAEGRMALKAKATLDNYIAEAVAILPEGGKASILGRYTVAADTYYKLTLDLEAGLILYKGDTELKRASIEELYQDGVKILPNTDISVKLYMFGNLLQGFVNGQLAISYVDDSPLISGVTGVAGTNGAAFTTLITSEAFALPAAAELSITDKDGNPLTNIQVYEGKVPNIFDMCLKVSYDGNTELIPLDFVLDYELLDYHVAVGETKTIPVAYNGSSIDFSYTVISRAADIAQLDADIAAMKAVSELTLEDADAVSALVNRYNDLSFKEKPGISDANVKKLNDAKEAILALRYAGKEILGDVIFTDSFDTAESDKQYTNDYAITTDRQPGNWFVFNGEMLEYESVTTIEESGGFQPSNLLIDRDYEATSISVDFQLTHKNAWAGLRFASRNGEYFKVWVTGKDGKNRIAVKKTESVVGQVYTTDIDPNLTIDLDKWYNLRVFQADGWVRIYINDILCYQFEDKVNIAADEILTHGTVGLATSEAWCKFDNLEIRGKELGYTPEDKATHDTDLPETQWADDFSDETAGSDPSHWLELSHRDDWKVKADGDNLFYGSTGCTGSESQTWLHVFETDVDYTADLRVTAKGSYATVGLMARLNTDTSYIKAGYDFTLQKWFIKVAYAGGFDEFTFYAAEKSEFALNTVYKVRLLVEGTAIQLFVNDGETPVVAADAGKKVSAGRVGVFNICCDVDVDNVVLKQLSGQGRVNDGVMEQYTSQAGVTSESRMFQVLELKDPDGTPNGNFLMSQDGDHWFSTDGGLTWVKDTQYSAYKGGSTLVLHDGKILNVVSYKNVYISEDYGITWKKQGTITWPEGWSYSQPAEHLSEVKLGNGGYRVFFTVGNNSNNVKPTDGIVGRSSICDIYYSDDQGKTWTMSENSPLQFANLRVWCESHVIKTEGVFEGNPLIMYSAYNNSDYMRYTLSYDEGKTWQGDYAMPQIPCGYNSMTIEEDPYNPGTYYMATFYNIPTALHLGLPRLRVALLRSTDGFNWEYLCDVDRWGDVYNFNSGHIMQGVNMYLSVAKDYVFVGFSRSDEFEPGYNHRKQVGRMYRFEKSKMDAYDVWPQEYVIPENTITHIEGTAETIALNSDLSDVMFDVYYYRADGDVKDQVPMDQAFINGLDTSKLGEQTVILDYKHFRTVFTVNVVKGDAPALNITEGKTYCGEQTVTATDVNGDLVSVTVNGVAVTVTDGKFTVPAAEGVQTIVATDKAGNVTTVKITVNAGHKGGTATCTDKAKCEVCGEAYGELNADKHTKEAKWTIGADKHSKVYECCGKVVVAEEAHEWKDGKCEECGYEAELGTQQKPIEIPADKETVKEEAKVEAGEEKHYELDEGMAGKVITVKGEGAYIIVDGKKYEAVNGIVEVKLPTKTGKISVVIGNAGTKAGSFSITIATPSEDNSDTGDNAAIVLFGSLMALSVLAAGALLIPNIRKRLLNK